MIGDAISRHDAANAGDIGIVAEREDARRQNLGGQKGLGPWLGGARRSPGPLAVASQTVDEDNASNGLASNFGEYRTK